MRAAHPPIDRCSFPILRPTSVHHHHHCQGTVCARSKLAAAKQNNSIFSLSQPIIKIPFTEWWCRSMACPFLLAHHARARLVCVSCAAGARDCVPQCAWRDRCICCRLMVNDGVVLHLMKSVPWGLVPSARAWFRADCKFRRGVLLKPSLDPFGVVCLYVFFPLPCMFILLSYPVSFSAPTGPVLPLTRLQRIVVQHSVERGKIRPTLDSEWPRFWSGGSGDTDKTIINLHAFLCTPVCIPAPAVPSSQRLSIPRFRHGMINRLSALRMNSMWLVTPRSIAYHTVIRILRLYLS